MAINAFEAIAGAVNQRIKRVTGDLNILKRFKSKVNFQIRAITGAVGNFTSAVKNLLGQFSNKDGYSAQVIEAKASAALEASWSNQAGVQALDDNGIYASSEESQAIVQEALNAVQAGLLTEPSNAFTLARVVYDNATNLNIRRAELLNELSESVGMAKLMHDVIPAGFYDNTDLELLQSSVPQLEEVVRKITLACGAISNGGSPAELVSTIENDFEVVLRRIAREDVYDSSQFSAPEYLALINRIKAASEELSSIDEQLTTIRSNVADYQTNFVTSFQSTFTECGTLATARSNIQSIIDRINQLDSPTTENPGNQAVANSEDFILDMAVTLALLREFVQKKQKLEDVLTVTVSPERTSFEASQAAIALVPSFSTSLPDDALNFARRAERRLTSPTVDPTVSSLFSTLAVDIPTEHANSVAFQEALNSYNIDIVTGNRRFFVQSLKDLDALGMDRVFDALLLGDITVGFDPNSIGASSIGVALQQAAAAFEYGISGISGSLGACKVSTKFGQAKISGILANIQSKVQTQVLARLSFKDFVDKRIAELEDKVLKKLERSLEEVESIRIFEKCE